LFECLFSIGHPGELAKFCNHGTGLELDELPVLASRFRTPIRESNVIANELKFLFPGKVVVGKENTSPSQSWTAKSSPVLQTT
jgi:Xaa-Pro aminopeptidase